MNAAVVDREAEILTRTVNPDEGNFSPEAARAILSLRFADFDRERINELAARARDRSLTPDERAELDGYEHIGFLFELLKSKARLSLKLAGQSPLT